MSLRSPLGRVRGLGSAKEGVHHWWMQRLTAIALVPLCLWLVVGLIGIADAVHGDVVAWVAAPLNTTALLLFVVALLYHAQLGMQVIIEDYLHIEWLKLAVVIGLRFLTAVLIVIGVLAIFHIAFRIA